MADKRFRLKRHYSIIAHSPDIVELRYGTWNATSFTITDEAQSGRLFRLVSGFDGTVSPAELAKREGVQRHEAEALLDHLMSLGVVESESSNALDHYLDSIVPSLRTTSPSPAAMPVRLLGDQELTGPIRRNLEDSLGELEIITVLGEDPAWQELTTDGSWWSEGFNAAEKIAAFEGWRGGFLIYAAKSVHPIRLQSLNRICLELAIPWLHATIDGPFLLVGPLFTPGRRACYECFEQRVQMNLKGSESYQRYKRALLEGRAMIGAPPVEAVMGAVLSSHIALEALNFLVTGSGFLAGKVLSLYLPTMEFTFNEVLRLPGCSACGSLLERDDSELYFNLGALLRSVDAK